MVSVRGAGITAPGARAHSHGPCDTTRPVASWEALSTSRDAGILYFRTLKLRYADCHTITRARTITPTCSELELYPVIREIYYAACTRRLPVRLLGVALSNLCLFDHQLELFHTGHEELHGAVDQIREKFGFDAINLARDRP